MLTGERSPQIGHRPTGLKRNRRGFMDVIEQKHPCSEACESFLHPRPVKSGSGGSTFQPFHYSLFVAFGLQTANEPGSRIG